MRKRKNLESVVGDTTHAAQDLGKDALAQASAYLQQAQDYLTPLAKDAKKKGAKFAADAVDAVQPKLDEALSKVSPAIDEAYARLAPAVDSARDKVQHNFIPAVSDMLHNAADDLAKVELPSVPAPKKKKSGWKTFGQVLLATGLLAGVIVAIRKFLAPSDSGWQAHEPSSPYVPTSTQNLVDDLTKKGEEVKDAAAEWIDDAGDKVDAVKAKAADIAEDAADKLDDAKADAKDAVEDAKDALKKGADSAKAKASDAKDAAEGDAAPFAGSPYGEGSYVGTEPPEGFSIKGNERSMKFHVPGNGGYERTIADVWFASEDAATAAGFTKAQR
ncbi:hypothetical protein G7070_12425 [Propioniciclava coleopterorum]|uniref:Uncharacterized protein n=1 Tax=Propioniciclava coleopterorum TaxID=2714937 RepID=A0A6G7Y803_9ACTN|nr:hypothetical protein [Propioniciclava coleopterorum]QIK72923.1 hypothetical protein G7070_12425 [Propioniciclava coleopterorum]